MVPLFQARDNKTLVTAVSAKPGFTAKIRGAPISRVLGAGRYVFVQAVTLSAMVLSNLSLTGPIDPNWLPASVGVTSSSSLLRTAHDHLSRSLHTGSEPSENQNSQRAGVG